MDILTNILKEIDKNGGKSFFVGGFVRDSFLGLPNKDIDIEVFNITLEELQNILSMFGKVDEIGKQFAILKIHGLDVDFSLPRIEKKIGNTHKSFDIEINPFIDPKIAAKRRDLTINSIMKNTITGEIIDNFNGLNDLENKTIRFVDKDSFKEDPLRVLRIAQFASRFDFKIDNKTFNLCKEMVEQGDLKFLPKERIFSEFEKLLLKGKKPSIGLKFLKDINFLHPVFMNLINCNHNPIFHPEGDVWNHTMLVIDKAAELRNKATNPLVFMFGALCHDLGKPLVIDEKGSCKNHAKEGIKPTIEFLQTITNSQNFIDKVCKLVEEHMNILDIAFSSTKNLKRLIIRLDDTISFNDLLLLGECDHLGRLGNFDFTNIREWFEKTLEETGKEIPKPIVTGKDLIQLGLKPSPLFKEILDKAFSLQIDNLSKEDIICSIRQEFNF